MINYVGLLTVKEGKREEYLSALKATGLIETFRRQKGNVYYQVAKSVMEDSCVVVTDGWENMDTFRAHDTCHLVDEVWKPLAEKYVLETKSYLLETRADLEMN